MKINENILKYLVEENPLNTQKNLTQFLKEFSKIPNHATDEKTKLFIKKIFKKNGNKVLLDKVSFILNKKLDEINILIDKNESLKEYPLAVQRKDYIVVVTKENISIERNVL